MMGRHLHMVGSSMLELEHDELMEPEADLSQVDEALARRDDMRIACKDARAAKTRVADIAQDRRVDGEGDGEAERWDISKIGLGATDPTRRVRRSAAADDAL